MAQQLCQIPLPVLKDATSCYAYSCTVHDHLYNVLGPRFIDGLLNNASNILCILRTMLF